MIERGVRGPQATDPEPHWTPRRVSRDRTCSFCGATIAAGLKGYMNAQLQEWECLGCRTEAVRAAAALEGR